MLRIALSLAITLSLTVIRGEAFEPRFYSTYWNDPLEPEVFKTARQADRVLWCNNVDSIEVNYGETSPIYFTRDQVRYFLKHKQHRELLVIWFGKPIMWTGKQNVQKVLGEYKRFVADFGYKRVLILGAHFAGVYVVYDSLDNDDQKEPTSQKVDKPAS
jgi:hypothetical protein